MALFRRNKGPNIRNRAPQLANGTFDVGSAEFRRLCAVSGAGICLMANGYQHNPAMRAELKGHIEAGRLPTITETQTVTLEKIAEAYNARGPRLSDGPMSVSAKTSEEVQNRIQDLLEQFAEARASDMEISLRDHRSDIRMKAGGSWHDVATWTREEGQVAADCLFDARDEGSGQTTREERSFQSYSISSTTRLRLPKGVVKLRGQRGFHENSSAIGDHHVLRFFYADGDESTADLTTLGFDDEVLEALDRIKYMSDGAVIVGGSTGDGKSTTLIRLVEKIIIEAGGEKNGKGGRKKIITLEDPVELRLNYTSITQIPISSAGDGDERSDLYRLGLMHFSRINADAGIISEVRDGYGARQVLQFVSSGHLCCTTIHTNNVNEIPFRIMGWQISPAELSRPDIMRILLQQKLVPSLCPDCCIEYDGSQTLPPFLRVASPNVWNQLRFRNHDGCQSCLKSYSGIGKQAWAGYARLVAVGEMIVPDDKYLGFIAKNDALGAKQHWLTPKSEGGMGGRSIGQKITAMAVKGLVDPHDAQERKAEDYASGLRLVQG